MRTCSLFDSVGCLLVDWSAFVVLLVGVVLGLGLLACWVGCCGLGYGWRGLRFTRVLMVSWRFVVIY